MAKNILCDVDGVCLGWNPAFFAYMEECGRIPLPDFEHCYSLSERFGLSKDEMNHIVTEFNHSDRMRFLEPFRDATEYIPRLKREGYDFHFITSLSDHPDAYANRKYNLEAAFGRGIISSLVCLPMGSSKLEALRQWSGSGHFWIEDHVENANDGLALGLQPLLMDAEYNRHDSVVQRVYNWKEIYDIIIDSL